MLLSSKHEDAIRYILFKQQLFKKCNSHPLAHYKIHPWSTFLIYILQYSLSFGGITPQEGSRLTLQT
ncbi:hypothetical protein FKM82_015130 [Ascaphus truei]